MSKPTPLATLIGLTTAALITNAPLADTGALSFEKLDSDNDGLISRSEGESVPELENLWSQIDEDDSGVIDRTEFSAFEEQMRQGKGLPGDMNQEMHEKAKELMQQRQPR